MTQDYLDDPKRFLSQVSASEEHDDLFGNLYMQYDDKSESVACPITPMIRSRPFH
jgi:hypothetical protein